MIAQAGMRRVNGCDRSANSGTGRAEDGDRVEVDGDRRRHCLATWTYLLLNKPVGVVTTMRDPQGRRSVADFVGAPGVFPVGRLGLCDVGCACC